MTKAEMRTLVRARLASLPPESVRTRSEAITELLVRERAYADARTVMIYLALPGEVDLAGLAERVWGDGKRVVGPRTDWAAKRLFPYRMDSLQGLEAGPRNTLQPAAGQLVPMNEIDLVLTPGLAFDASGYRLGRGAGFYDRFLAELRAATASAGNPTACVSCGVAFEEQIVDAVPRDAWDVRLDLIATDQRVIRPPVS